MKRDVWVFWLTVDESRHAFVHFHAPDHRTSSQFSCFQAVSKNHMRIEPETHIAAGWFPRERSPYVRQGKILVADIDRR